MKNSSESAEILVRQVIDQLQGAKDASDNESLSVLLNCLEYFCRKMKVTRQEIQAAIETMFKLRGELPQGRALTAFDRVLPLIMPMNPLERLEVTLKLVSYVFEHTSLDAQALLIAVADILRCSDMLKPTHQKSEAPPGALN